MSRLGLSVSAAMLVANRLALARRLNEEITTSKGYPKVKVIKTRNQEKAERRRNRGKK